MENNYFSSCYHFQQKPYPKNFIERCLRIMKGVPYPIREYHQIELRRLFELVEANDYRFIFVRYCYNTTGLFSLPAKFRSRTIVDFDDVLSGAIYASFFNAKKGAHRLIMRELNRKLLTRYESKCLNFGAALFCSELDRKKLDPAGRGNTFVVPNIYENRMFAEHDFGDGHKRSNHLLFIGTLHYRPNVEGLDWFMHNVFRRFKAEFNDAKLIVVGHAPCDYIKTLCASEEGVELHPDVPDIHRYYERCRVVVVPLLIGGGTRIKILEAALAKRAVLSTPAGAEGLELKDGIDLLLFETAEDFCAKYRQLANQNAYQNMVMRARRIVQTKYSSTTFEESMRQVLGHIEGSISGRVPAH
jgi:glycosyltransferase involved in cell wall biosynthesis